MDTSKKLKQLFYENYKPYAVIPILGLSRKFILKKGFLKDDIEKLVLDGFIEKFGNGYRMTENTLKLWMGVNSCAYRNLVMSE